MTVLTLLAVLLVGQPDRPHDHAHIHDLPGLSLPAAPAKVEPAPLPGGPAGPELTPGTAGQPLNDAQTEAHEALAALGRADEWPCMADIFEAESTWNPDGIGDRDRGGSVGLGQRHIPVWGDPRPWTIEDQVRWFSQYADDRYGGWCPARDRWADRAYDVIDGRMIGGWW